MPDPSPTDGATVDILACVEALAAALEAEVRAGQRRAAPQLGAMTAGQVAQVALGLAGFCRDHGLGLPAALLPTFALLAGLRSSPPADDAPAVQLPKELAALVEAELRWAKAEDPLRPGPDYVALDAPVIRVAGGADTSRANVRRWRKTAEIRRAVHERLAGPRLPLLQLLEAAGCALSADRRRLTYLAPAARLAALTGLPQAVVEGHRGELKYALAVLENAADLQDLAGELPAGEALARVAETLAVVLPRPLDLSALQGDRWAIA